jgi:beta-mannosidase
MHRLSRPMIGDSLLTDWQVASAPAGSIADSLELSAAGLSWIPMQAPGTAASALRAAGSWADDSARDFDADDWWFGTMFTASPHVPTRLRFSGLATIAEVWLNDALILQCSDMFIEHTIAVEAQGNNTLVVVCRSVRSHLAARRPRPRWKTRLVESQQLRWVRTSLLGRMPTWPPMAAPVGPWRPVQLLIDDQPRLETRRVDCHVDGRNGSVEYEGAFTGPVAPTAARLTVGPSSVALSVTADGDGWTLSGRLILENPARWFPMTHGSPSLHDVSVEVEAVAALEYALEPVGFRSVTVDVDEGAFSLAVNGVSVFCRGACWVPLDPVALSVGVDELRRAVRQAADAGMNMVRITGTMVPEQDEFYTLCDELGIMIWHDMMFANMDYPVGNKAFCEIVETEVAQLLGRLQRHPSVIVVCGGSEVEQQAAMMGLDSEDFPNKLGRDILPELVASWLPATVYVPCSPSGGSFPFSVSTGVSHYYGVGAYLRPLEDARRASVRFTSECLAFANVSCRQSIDEFLREGERPGHAPRWKARVPRDRGAGWDFEDVRDHYVRAIFGVDPLAVRYSDWDRYLDLGRGAVCVAIESSLAEWRRPGSSCAGALLFTLRDLAHGPGWGLIDASGRPKSAYYSVARMSLPAAVVLTDEGLNGLVAHILNDGPERFAGSVRIRLFGLDGSTIAAVEQEMEIDGHGSRQLSVDAMFGGFRDLTYSFRFGPQIYDCISVQLVDEHGTVVSSAIHLPGGQQRPVRTDISLTCTGHRLLDETVELTISSGQFAQFVSLSTPEWTPSDDWFHLAPGDERVVRFVREREAKFSGELRALNSQQVVALSETLLRSGSA